jgi:hypothetical protein
VKWKAKRSVLSAQDVQRIARGLLMGQPTRCFSAQLYLAGEDARAVEQSHQPPRSDLSILKRSYSLLCYQNKASMSSGVLASAAH